MVRILQMIGSLNVGGSQTMILNLYRNIDREKIQFDFVLDHPNERYFAADAEALGARIYNLPGFTGFNAHEVKTAWDSFLTAHPEYKVLHSHVRSYASLYLPVAKKHGLKTIIHSHNTSNGPGVSSVVKQLMQRPLRDQADVLMACSREAGEWLFGKEACERDNYIFLPNAVDTRHFRLPESVREKYRAEFKMTDKLVIGHVGRFQPAKNQSFLLDAFKLVHDRKPDSALLLVGDGAAFAPGARKRPPRLAFRTASSSPATAATCRSFCRRWMFLPFPQCGRGCPSRLLRRRPRDFRAMCPQTSALTPMFPRWSSTCR